VFCVYGSKKGDEIFPALRYLLQGCGDDWLFFLFANQCCIIRLLVAVPLFNMIRGIRAIVFQDWQEINGSVLDTHTSSFHTQWDEFYHLATQIFLGIISVKLLFGRVWKLGVHLGQPPEKRGLRLSSPRFEPLFRKSNTF